MPRRTVEVVLTYEIEMHSDSMCDAAVEQERERWHLAAVVLDADYVVTAVESTRPDNNVWSLDG
jgi:hypothetical protein